MEQRLPFTPFSAYFGSDFQRSFIHYMPKTLKVKREITGSAVTSFCKLKSLQWNLLQATTKMSSLRCMWLLTGGGHLQELRPYWDKILPHLNKGNCRDKILPPVLNVLFM